LFQHVEVNLNANLKKKKRNTGRCRLCGEQWWDIGPRVVYLGARGLHPTGRIHGSQVQQKYGKCASAKINAGDPENSVWREMCQCAVFHASTMRVEDAK
jgi:hypothetical protein